MLKKKETGEPGVRNIRKGSIKKEGRKKKQRDGALQGQFI